MSSFAVAEDGCEGPLFLGDCCLFAEDDDDLKCALDPVRSWTAGVVASLRFGARAAIRAGGRGMDYSKTSC